MGNAIVARLGLSTEGFKRDLAMAQSEIDKFDRKNSGFGKGGSGGSGGGGGGGRFGSTRATGDVINAATGTRGAGMELNAITHTLGIGLGPAVGLIAGAAAAEKLREALKNLKEANDAVAASFRESNSAIVGQGSDAVATKLAQMDELKAKLEATRGFASSLASIFGGKGQKESFREQYKLEAQRTDLLHDSVTKTREETEARLKAVQAGERETELYKVRSEAAKKIAEINGDRKLDGTGLRKGMIDEANASADEAAEGINDRFDAKERELSLEREIAGLKSTYENPEKQVAQARINAANAELAAARSPEAKDLANTRKLAAEAELKAAQRSEGRKRRDEHIERDHKEEIEEAGQIGEAGRKAKQGREELRLRHIEEQRKQDDLENESVAQRFRAVRETNDKIRDRSQLSLGELAAHGHGLTGARARQAERLEGQARRAALHGNLRNAESFTARAEKIKAGLGTLKDSEKLTSGFESAINRAQVLQDVKTAVQQFVIQMK